MTPESPPDDAMNSHCDRCDAPYDPGDNFCRRCGAPLGDVPPPDDGVKLPAVSDSRYEPVPWRPMVPAAVQGAAVIAAGTLAEMVLRGLASRLFRAGARRATPPPQNDKRGTEVVKAEPDAEPAESEAQVVSETWFFRRVRVRR